MADFMIRFLLSNLFLGIFIGILAFCKWIFRRTLSSQMQYHLWFLLFFFLLVPFVPVCSFSLPAQISSFFSTFSSQKGFAHHPLTDSPLSSTFSNTSEWMNDFTISISRQVPSIAGQILFLLWCTGIGIMFIFFIRSVRQLYHLSSTALPLENAEISSLYISCLKELGITRNIPVYTTAFLPSPAITGIFQPRIYLPLRLISGYPHSALRYILLHELQHYRQKDGLLNLFLNIFCALYWFNPAVWYVLHEIRIDREIACDTSVLETVGETSRQEYGAALINFAETLSHTPFSFSVGLGGSMPQMKRRILNIASYQAPTPWKKAKGYVLVLVISLLLISMSPVLSMQAAKETSFRPDTSDSIVSTIDLSSYFRDYEGTFVLYDLQKDHYQIYHPEQAYKRISPDSTYKLYSALFGLEEKIITPKDSMIPWDHNHYPFDAWNKNHTLDSAMSASVNWYFQTIDKKLGHGKIRSYLQQIHYGNESIDQSDSYWMESSLKISAFEQVSLLTDFYQNTFAFNPEHIAAVKESIRLITHGQNTLYGKTGTGNVNGQNVNGWFIGYIENSQNTYFFATNIQAEQQASGSTASQITLDLLEDMGIWN